MEFQRRDLLLVWATGEVFVTELSALSDDEIQGVAIQWVWNRLAFLVRHCLCEGYCKSLKSFNFIFHTILFNNLDIGLLALPLFKV